MISFSINNEFLDMPANIGVALKRFSTLFQFEGFVQDDFTFPIPFPNTPRNRRIFNFPHIVENASRLRPKWEAVLWYNGVPRLKGEIRAKNPINDRVITANFVSGIGMIGDDIGRRKLAEILNEEIVIHEQEVFKSIDIIFSFATEWKVKINGTPYEGTSLADLVTQINADTLANYTASSISNIMTLTMDDAGIFAPFHIEADTASNARVSNVLPLWLILYNEAYVDFVGEHLGAGRLDKKIRFGTFGNLAEISGAVRDFPVVNYIYDGEFRPNIYRNQTLPNSEMENRTFLAPMITLKTVLDAIADYYDIVISFFALDEDDVLFSSFVLDQPVKFFNGESLLLYPNAFNLAQLVPDMTVNDLLKALQIAFNAELTYDVELRRLDITPRQVQINTRSYEDITLSCSPPSDVQLSIQKGLRFALQTDTRDKVTDADLIPADFLIDEGERTLAAGFGTPGMRNHTLRGNWPQNAALLTVWVDLPRETNFPLKFARYVDGATPYLDSRPFLWDGPNGLIATYWGQSVELENNPVTIANTWRMPRNEIFAPRWGQRWRIDRNDYFLQTFFAGLTINGPNASECVFVRVPFFVEGAEPEPRPTAWRALASSLRCAKDGDNVNTGIATYDFLEQYYTDDDSATGVTKFNTPGDPDYIAPAENLVACPVTFGGYEPGNLYIIMNPALTSSEEKVRINGTEYTLRTTGPNPFPYPYAMGATTNVEILTASTPMFESFLWTIKVYTNEDKVFETTRTVGPNNQGPPGTEAINLTYRTVILSNSLFDVLKINRVIITRELI